MICKDSYLGLAAVPGKIASMSRVDFLAQPWAGVLEDDGYLKYFMRTAVWNHRSRLI